MLELIIFICLLGLGFFFGTQIEKKHYKSIIQRERMYSEKPVVSFIRNTKDHNVQTSRLVTGSCVISIDFFKKIIAGFKNFTGGNISACESLVDRARREATLRMIDDGFDSDMIINTKIETSTIGRRNRKGRKSISAIAVLAYGTAVKLNPNITKPQTNQHIEGANA